MRIDLNSLLNQAEECIISGQIREAGELLKRLRSKQIPRKDVCRAAQLYRRVGWVEQGLRLLMPIVRPKANLIQSASPEERAEFAVGLQFAGSLEEARQILNGISESEVPEVLLYKAIFRFPEWDYAQAIPDLNRLIQISPPDSYLEQVARLNLAAALVVEEKFADAEPILDDLTRKTAERGQYLLHCNSLEISAQAAIFSGDFSRAEQLLTKAESVLTGIKTFDRLWLIKWRAILQAMLNEDPLLLRSARVEADRRLHWETSRELDFVACKIRPNESLLLKLYFGSRAVAYRKRLERHFHLPDLNRVYVGRNGEFQAAEPQKFVRCFQDLQDELSPGDLPHLLLIQLLSDTYSGARSGEIHSRLFPKQFFNPYTSLDRVHHVVQRLREMLTMQIPGLTLRSDGGFYRLDFSALETPIEIPREWPPPTALNVKLHALRERLNRDQFDSKDVQSAFELSRSAANRLIASWREADIVGRHGFANPPRYKLKKAA